MSLQKNLQKLQELNLPEDQFVIVCSSILEAKGIRIAKDLDVVISNELWQQLASQFPVEAVPGFARIVIEDIEIFDETIFRKKKVATLEEIMNTAEVQNGIRFMNIHLLKKFKQILHREKDVQDILLIERYIEHIKGTEESNAN